MRSYQLSYSLTVINIVGFALLGMAAMQGWIARVIEADVTGLVFVIFGVFVVGLVICAWRVVALYTTLCGAVLGLWLTVNYHLLWSGTAALYSEILACHGRL